jgi:hypothetical protein
MRREEMKKKISREDKDWLENYRYKYKEELKNNYEDPKITGLVRLRCRDWMDLAKAVIAKYGDEGKEIVRKTRWATAKPIAEQIKKNYGTDVQAIHRFYRTYLPWWEPIWDIFLGDMPNRMMLRMQCQCGDYWRERIIQGTAPRELCRIWCEWDVELPKYLNPKITCELRKWIPDGNPYCEFLWTTK